MDRRSFVKRFFGGAAVAAAVIAVPSLLKTPVEPIVDAPLAATIGEYNEYANFSSFEIADEVARAANELGYRAGVSVSELYAQTYDAEPRVGQQLNLFA